MQEFSSKETARQDLVDNSIYEMINEINPSNHKIDWDIEMIGEIRDAVSYWIVNRLNLCSEQNFYPFLNE